MLGAAKGLRPAVAGLQRLPGCWAGLTRTMASKSDQDAAADASAHKLYEMRLSYSNEGVSDEMLKQKPMDVFEAWMQDARKSGNIEPNAMSVSTCVNNRPSSRIVLLKLYDERGFVWFTNYESRKGEQLEANPYGSILFFWQELQRSVRIEGRVEKVEAELSDEYFAERPRGSQIGALASDQSRPIESREALEAKEAKLVEHYSNDENKDQPIKRPEHWGGYRLVPDYIEFWKGRPSRLHDRIAFTKDEGVDSWSAKRLQP